MGAGFSPRGEKAPIPIRATGQGADVSVGISGGIGVRGDQIGECAR